MSKKNKNTLLKYVNDISSYLHNHVQTINNSKIFAGLVIITLNISSKFVTIKLSKSMESYLKHTFSKQILIFAIAWMGTRDIYIALIIVLLFTIFMEYLFDEESQFCILPKEFQDYHISLLDNNISEEDVKKAEELIIKAKEQGVVKPVDINNNNNILKM